MDEVTSLASAARAGDHRAAAAFIRATQQQVWRLCAHLVDAATADDLTQETYLRAFRALPGFQGRSSARTWLLSIARRACMDELRARTRRRERDSRLSPDAGDEQGPDPSGQVAAGAMVARLAPDRRAAFVLTQLLGFSYQEAAAICGCPAGTIRSRIARARSDLITMLEPEGGRRELSRARTGLPGHGL
jgi:RNA polymerase sigma-70 factor, ECF subfamily